MNTLESTMLTQKPTTISLPCPTLATRRLPAPHFLEPTLLAAVRDCNLQRFVTLDGTLQRENRGHEHRWITTPSPSKRGKPEDGCEIHLDRLPRHRPERSVGIHSKIFCFEKVSVFPKKFDSLFWQAHKSAQASSFAKTILGGWCGEQTRRIGRISHQPRAFGRHSSPS